MRTFQIRQVAATAALALMAATPLAACGADTVSPLPVQAAETTSAAPAGPTPTPAPSATITSAPPRSSPATHPKPVKTRTTRPTPKSTSTCYGAVRRDIDLQNTELALVRSMCFHTGGVLRLKGIGPGLVTATPESLVDPNYEAGVVDLRFLRAGTVTVKIPQEEQTYTITVVVIS
jgi:hypothetical protein